MPDEDNIDMCLMSAIKEDDVARVKYIIQENKIDLEKPVGDDTWLIYAIRCTAFNVIDYFLYEQKVNPTQESHFGYQPAHVAASLNDVYAMSKLLGLKVSVNALNHTGKTALYLAAEYDNDEMMDFLLKNGADPAIPDFSGIYPYEVAQYNSNDEFADRLRPDRKKSIIERVMAWFGGRGTDEKYTVSSDTLTPQRAGRKMTQYTPLLIESKETQTDEVEKTLHVLQELDAIQQTPETPKMMKISLSQEGIQAETGMNKAQASFIGHHNSTQKRVQNTRQSLLERKNQ